jgi:hypothetical protein
VNEFVQMVLEEVEKLRIATDIEGIILKTDTLGSLEAIADILRNNNIPIRSADVGDVSKRDVTEAAVVKEHEPLYGAILAFNSRILPDAQSFEPFVKLGIPITSTIPAEGTHLSSGSSGLGLLKNAPHSNAAKVFANWFLSKEGQTAPVAGQYGRVQVLVVVLPQVISLLQMFPLKKMQNPGRHLDYASPRARLRHASARMPASRAREDPRDRCCDLLSGSFLNATRIFEIAERFGKVDIEKMLEI